MKVIGESIPTGCTLRFIGYLMFLLGADKIVWGKILFGTNSAKKQQFNKKRFCISKTNRVFQKYLYIDTIRYLSMYSTLTLVLTDTKE